MSPAPIIARVQHRAWRRFAAPAWPWVIKERYGGRSAKAVKEIVEASALTVDNMIDTVAYGWSG